MSIKDFRNVITILVESANKGLTITPAQQSKIIDKLVHFSKRYESLCSYKKCMKKNIRDLQAAYEKQNRKLEDLRKSLESYKKIALRKSEKIRRLENNRCKLCEEVERERRYRKRKLSQEDHKTKKSLQKLKTYLEDNSVEIDPEMQQVLNDNFWDLLA